MAEPQSTYYEIMGVSPNSSKPDIDRAYLSLKTGGALDSAALWELERAYVTLCDPNLKRKYDQDLKAGGPAAQPAPGGAVGSGAGRGDSRPLSLSLLTEGQKRLGLGLGFVGLVAVLALYIWPTVSWQFRTYSAGTKLVYTVGGEALGEVRDYDSSHRFSTGVNLAAYQIRLHATGKEVWISKEDINKRARPAGN